MPPPPVLKQAPAVRKKLASCKALPGPPATFPVDFFEACTQLNDAEFGGNDLLEVYNQQQLKSRLGMGGNKFVCSTKPGGFTLEVRNRADSDRTLLVGCRILVGTHSLERVPTYFQVEIFGGFFPIFHFLVLM